MGVCLHISDLLVQGHALCRCICFANGCWSHWTTTPLLCHWLVPFSSIISDCDAYRILRRWAAIGMDGNLSTSLLFSCRRRLSARDSMVNPCLVCF
ncbi:hypothetical protein I7I48_06644 [Histoplasma ohiense]|nr:hypothetical protein I7I48_06644 [Histoplasma ohiense (nom. inval.)]